MGDELGRNNLSHLFLVSVISNESGVFAGTKNSLISYYSKRTIGVLTYEYTPKQHVKEEFDIRS